MESKKKRRNHTALISKTSEPSNISKLPDECLICIFSLLPIVDRVKVQRVCKRWHSLSLLSWSSCKTLTLDLNDWGFDYNIEMRINRVMLRDVLKLCGNYVTRIDFFYYLEEWDSRKSINGSQSLFQEFEKLCPNLTSLCLSPIKITAKGMEYLAKNQSKLMEIDMSYYKECDKAISLLFQNNQHLRCLKLVLPRLSGECWLNLNPLAVEEIKLMAPDDGANGFRAALERFVNLRIFKIRAFSGKKFMAHIDEFLAAISLHGEKLEKLAVTCYSNSVNLRSMHFKHFQNLQEFVLRGPEIKIDNTFFKEFANHCSKITSLELENIFVTDLDIINVVKLPKLRELHLSQLSEVTDAVFLNSLPSLTELYCSKCPQMKNFGLCELLHESAKNLRILDIEKCENLDIKELIQDAKKATDKRIDGPVLKMKVSGNPTLYSWRNEKKKIELSKFLKLTLVM